MIISVQCQTSCSILAKLAGNNLQIIVVAMVTYRQVGINHCQCVSKVKKDTSHKISTGCETVSFKDCGHSHGRNVMDGPI